MNELEKDPKLLLGEDSWQILVDVNDVYAKEKEECDASLEKLMFVSDKILYALQEFHCPECGSGLLETEDSGNSINPTCSGQAKADTLI